MPSPVIARRCWPCWPGRRCALARHRTGLALAARPGGLRPRRGRRRAQAHLGRRVPAAARHARKPGRRAWPHRAAPPPTWSIVSAASTCSTTRTATLRLTPDGRREALRVIRIHRLWERYLADETGLDAREWHAHAERREHGTSDQQAEALAATLGHPRYDPHGDPIPTPSGELPPHQGDPAHPADARPGRRDRPPRGRARRRLRADRRGRADARHARAPARAHAAAAAHRRPTPRRWCWRRSSPPTSPCCRSSSRPSRAR